MTTETTISDAISQLEMLGIDRKKAINALSRYNYNVERAADFIFSGGADTEESFFLNETEFTRNNNEDFLWSQATPFDKISTTTTTEQPSQIQQHISINDHSTVTSHTEAEEEGEEEEDMEQEQKRAVLIKDYQNQGKSSDVTRDNASWSVVPFTANSSLTWWRDPDAPSDRAAIDNIPIGLRPPSYHFAYAPIIIQALFHITLFRSAILSYRPTPQTWGNSTNYWKGFGEPVHGYIVKPPPQQQRQQQSSQLTSDDTIMTIDKDESISLTPNIMDSSINNNVNGPTTDIWDSIPDRKEFQPDEPKPMTTMTEPSDTSILRMDELVSMTKDQIGSKP
ncbi:uncharacterized protein BX664DRAFT_174749 [Halteromyces radiatus]|uniref:uncharacterized protein n=1 Tax=Halteromyces radiatus TaxID=101107 RepID=UPI002220173A|nr:uncharacterized protein BX664DRAFT_174749 [Halteromyces radiatus]KAI8084897.1 hypothetical protein BX664DRAFT_174749 [Halteromyces radiatus]